MILTLGLVTLNWHGRHVKDYDEISLCILQLWWPVCQADAACSGETTFTPLTEFYMSFLETAATCWPETANTDPSRCWVSHPEDGYDHEIDACSLQYLQIYPFIFSLMLSTAAVWVCVTHS